MATEDDYLTVHEVARLLRLSEDAVRARLREGRLPGYRLGGKAGWRISRRELQEWLEARRGGRPGGDT